MSKQKIEFDELQMYCSEPYVIDLDSAEGSITIVCPKMGDIIRIGEKKFYSTLNIFITTTTAYRLPLWDAGIDWNTISNFDLFMMLYPGIDFEVSKLIFGDINFSNFQIVKKETGEKPEVVLYEPELNIEINEEVFEHITQYLQKVFNMEAEEKLTTDPVLKKWYIEKDRRQKHIDEMKREKGEAKTSSLLPIISACINHPGFKYNLQELRAVGVYQFYDSVRRLQIYEQTTACLRGMYSGFVDGSKLSARDYDFMRTP